MRKVYIIVGNDGFPRFADPEAQKIYVAKSLDAALDTAKDMVKELPYVVFGVYELSASVFSDGQSPVVVGADGKEAGKD